MLTSALLRKQIVIRMQFAQTLLEALYVLAKTGSKEMGRFALVMAIQLLTTVSFKFIDFINKSC